MIRESRVLLVEFTVEHPILHETLAARPGDRVVWERSDRAGERRIVLAWFETDEFDGLDAALAADPTVSDSAVLTETDDRRLYRLDLAEEGYRTSLYPVLVEESGVIRSLTADADGWHFRVEFPDRSSFDRFRCVCDDYGVSLRLDRILMESDRDRLPEYGLTPAQRDALQAAVSTGYLNIPRDASLDDLAASLDISRNAASERFHRAVESLVRATVHDGEE